MCAGVKSQVTVSLVTTDRDPTTDLNPVEPDFDEPGPEEADPSLLNEVVSHAITQLLYRHHDRLGGIRNETIGRYS